MSTCSDCRQASPADARYCCRCGRRLADDDGARASRLPAEAPVSASMAHRDAGEQSAYRLRRAESETKLRAIFDAEPECVKLVDADGRLIDMNRAGLEMLEADELDQVRDIDVVELILPEYRERYRADVAEVFRGGRTRQEFEIVGLRGTRRMLEQFAVPLFFPDCGDRVEQMLAVTRDITDKRRLDEEAASLRLQLAHVGRIALIGEMASGLAHELNQPLSALQLYVGAAMHAAAAFPSSQLQEYLGRIGEQATRAGDIVRGIRTFAKGDRSRRAPVDVNRLVPEILALMQHEIRQHNITVKLQLADGLPQASADAVQIQQVLANLIRNAVDAVQARPVREIRIYTETAAGDVGVGVEDSGPGIAASIQSRLFQPFQTDKPAGLGLGLAISRSLIEAHEGTISARRRSPEGTTFYFTLPAGARPGKAAATQSTRTVPANRRENVE